MRKYVVGIIIGAVLTFSGQALAETISNIGKKVTGEIAVDLNGNEIGTGVVISNKTYLPVRDLANAFKAGIEIKEGGVSLTTDSTTLPDNLPITDEEQREVDIRNLESKKSSIEEKIAKAQTAINKQEEFFIPRFEKSLKKNELEKREELAEIDRKSIEQAKALIEQKKAELIELQAQLDETNRKIAELEAQK